MPNEVQNLYDLVFKEHYEILRIILPVGPLEKDRWIEAELQKDGKKTIMRFDPSKRADVETIYDKYIDDRIWEKSHVTK